MIPQRSGMIDIGDGKVYYEAAGEGDPLVFLHAVPVVHSGMWDGQWDEFSQDYSVIRYDLLGFGRSDPQGAPVSRRQELYQVLEAVGIERAVFVGCSLSGETILDAALEHPDLVAGLVVVSAVPSGFEMQGEPPAELLEMLGALEQGDFERAFELQLRIWVDGPYRKPEQVNRLFRQGVAEMNRTNQAKGGWRFALEPVPDPLEPPAAEQLDRISVPTLIVAGGRDNSELLRAADVMAEAIPKAGKAIIPDAAHLAPTEKPAEFNQALRDFLRERQVSTGQNSPRTVQSGSKVK